MFEGLQDWVEECFFGFNLLTGDSVDSGKGLSERFFGSFVLLVGVHLCFPGGDVFVGTIENCLH